MNKREEYSVAVTKGSIFKFKICIQAGLQISVGHRIMSDRNESLLETNSFKSDVMTERKIKGF